MQSVDVLVKTIYPEVELPTYAKHGDSGMDVRAYLTEEIVLKMSSAGTDFVWDRDNRPTGIILMPGHRLLIPTGLTVAVPLGWEIQVRPRSGLAVKHMITVLNSPGTLDSGYRGELKVLLYNASRNEQFPIKHGDRIAQIVLCPVYEINWAKVEVLPDSSRGDCGFGSTGI